MKTDEFIGLPAGQAAELYNALREAGEDAEASRLHQAYFETHRSRLSAHRQVADAAPAREPPTTGAERSLPSQRSAIRRVGLALSALGLMAAVFSGAAGIGGSTAPLALACTSAGFALWLAGIIEDRLIEITQAISMR